MKRRSWYPLHKRTFTPAEDSSSPMKRTAIRKEVEPKDGGQEGKNTQIQKSRGLEPGHRPVCRAFVSVSWSFLGQFRKFHDLVGEHIKMILMNPVIALPLRQKNMQSHKV